MNLLCELSESYEIINDYKCISLVIPDPALNRMKPNSLRPVRIIFTAGRLNLFSGITVKENILNYYQHKLMKHVPVFMLLFTAIVYFSGCGTTIPFETIKSPLEIKTDGLAEDWNSLIKFIPDENIAAGFSAAGEDLRICIVTADKEKIRKILMTGFSVSFLPPDSRNKIVIKYPLAKEFPYLKPDFKEEPDFKAAESRLQKLIESQKELHVYDAEGDLINIHRSTDSGDFSFAIAYQNGLLVYELRLPLGFNNQRATGLRANPGDEIMVTLESGGIRKKGNIQDKGMKSGGAGRPGGGMPERPDDRPGAPDFKSFKIDIKLKLVLEN